ncbi:NACHT domain-containing protein [Streptomyces mirabilis]|uniref:hypothetical protein n=1 Tax=Streptomyces mirabilis TaxID=68239 RepID=UPI0036BC10E4
MIASGTVAAASIGTVNLWFRRRQDLDAAVHRLAVRSADVWFTEQKVYDLDDGRPLPVRWDWDRSLSRPREEVLSAPESDTGVVGDLYPRVYSRLPDRSHVALVGEAGTGKSAAMLLLLLAALADRTMNPSVQVPVWITLSSWNPRERRLRDLAAEAMEWLVPQLRKSSVYGPDAARRLFDEGRVALFLDGLDEMPKRLRESAMTAVATDAGHLRVVVTSRSGAYVRPMAPGRTGAPVVLRLRPLGSDAVADHLTYGQTGADRPVWNDVADHIRTNPRGPLAVALSTPLYVSLTRRAYDRLAPDHDPAELVAVYDPVEIQEMVIERFLDRVYPREPASLHKLEQHRHDAHGGPWYRRRRARVRGSIPARRLSRRRRQALRFLEWTAFHLGDGTDLRWWQIPTWVDPNRLVKACGLPVALSTVTLYLLGALTTGEQDMVMIIGALMVAAGMGAAFGALAFHHSGQAGSGPSGIRLRLPTADEASDVLVHGLTPAMPFFIGVAWVKGWLAGLAASAGIFLLGAFGGDLTSGGEGGLLALWSQPLTDGTLITVPRSYRGDALRTARVVLTATLAIGLVITFAGSIEGGPVLGLRYGCAIGAALGWLLGLGPAVVLRLTPFVADRRLSLGHRSFTRHLRTAHQLKVIRQAGVIYQFRHAALQTHLRRRYLAATATGQHPVDAPDSPVQ